jgi:hypothetical protein
MGKRIASNNLRPSGSFETIIWNRIGVGRARAFKSELEKVREFRVWL